MNSFEEWVRPADPQACVRELVDLLDRRSIDFFNLGPATTAGGRSLLLPLLLLSPRLSASCACASPEMGVDELAIVDASEVTVGLGQNTEGGFGNFRFCASFCVPPHVPFFPAGYAPSANSARDESSRFEMSFALGLECGDVALAALAAAAAVQNQGQDSKTPKERLPLSGITKALTDAFDAQLVPLEAAAKLAAERCSGHAVDSADAQRICYMGIDTSLNPGLDPSFSVGAAFEAALGEGRVFGSAGTLAVASAITKALKSLSVSKVGYSGLMLPPLEDSTLAKRQIKGSDGGKFKAQEGEVAEPSSKRKKHVMTSRRAGTKPSYGIVDLLSYSSVCGVGLDTVPIPGDTPAEKVASLMLDVAALSAKWAKPLSCRLFPVPGRKAGEMTSFDSPFLINTEVFEMP
mmetsp:Transcript_57889/g.131186  ORF Transcript_57889/g.131186 Transcript_57889/m.131186 type:complete len:406 (+) Transcript_57889:130-1347(+)